MGRRRQRRFLQYARDRRVGAFARRAARPVCDGNEVRLERFEAPNGVPQRFFHLFRLRRKKLE